MSNRSVFPQQVDTFIQLQDLPPELVQDAEELKELMKTPNKSSIQISRMNELLLELQNYYMSTETWNKLCDCIINMENFTLQKFTSYYRYRQNYDNTITYDLFNSVRYTDGNIYMLYTTSPSYQAGINPTDTNYWLKLSNKGDKGDKGNQWKGNYNSATNYVIDDTVNDVGSAYICIQPCINKQPSINPSCWQLFAQKGQDGVNGADGVGLVFKGDYSDTTIYNQNNCVQYQGSLYACKQDGVSGFSPTNTQYWELTVAKGGSVTVTTLRNTVIVSTNTSNINFFSGEITAFNPNLDSLFVYKNSTYLEKGQDYNINVDGMSIDCIGGSWDGTTIPITFNFVAIKNIVQTINFNDGTLIQDRSIQLPKLSTEVQNQINKIGTATLETIAQNLSDAVNENVDKIGNLSTLNTTDKTSAVNAINEVKNDITSHWADNLYQTAGGSAAAITLTINGTLVTGYPITFIASSNNNGSATTINGKPLYKPSTTTAPTLIAGKAYTVWYNAAANSGNGCFFIKASAEGDAVAGHVLAGKKFSNDNDTGIVGTMANHTSGTSAINTTVWYNSQDYHTRLALRIPLGAYIEEFAPQPGNTEIYIIEDNLIASNIVSGKSIFGVAGSATIQSLGGKKYASGTASSTSSALAFQFAGNTSTANTNYIEFNGLTFKPSVVVLTYHDNSTGRGYKTIYDEKGVIYLKTAFMTGYDPYSTSNQNGFYFKGDTSNAYVNSTGFRLPVMTQNSIYAWVAYE